MPRDLRVEYQRAPLGVGTRHPRFSWRVDHPQEAYELEVGSGWRPGVVASGETALIEYAGDPLRADTAYAWRVRSRGFDGAWSEWAVSSFETALWDAADWVARWIEPAQADAVIERWSLFDWIRGLGPDTPPDARLRPAQLLRQRFTVGPGLQRARLFASARGVYSSWMNGVRVGDQVLAPGSDSYPHRLSAQTYDVTDALAEGQNVLGVALADGWWAGRLGLTGSSAQFGTRTAAIWQLHLDYADGSRDVIASGAHARSTPGPWAYADLFIGEHFDRRAVPAGWDRPGFDDGGWTPVAEVDGGLEVLRPFTGEPVRRVQELPARTVTETLDGAVVDFGQVIAGRVRLRLRDSRPGQRVVIEHTETLDAEGSWFANIVGINKEQTDVFVAAGGNDEWEPEFTFHGFRYARVSGLEHPLDPADVVAVVIGSDLEQTGAFAASDPRIDRLHRNAVWSQRGNFLSVPTDCPQRERAGWTGDIQAFVGAAANNAQVVPFLSRWLENLRADQLPDGRIPIFSPRSPFDDDAAARAQGVGAIVAAGGWSDAIATVPWVLFERTGDRRVLEDNYDAMVRWIDYQRDTAAAEVADDVRPEHRDAHALLYDSGLHFGDWLTPSTMESGPLHEAIMVAPRLTGALVAPMFQAQTLTLAARIALVLGRNRDAADFADRAAAVRGAFAAVHVDDLGDLPVRLQGVYVLALAFDMVPPALRPRTAARLVELVRARGDRLDTGFLSTPYLLDVLWDAGHPDVARTLLWQSRMPSWLYEVDQGATTFWETWDAVSPDGAIRPMSMNHYAPGAVDDWLYRRVAGLRATSPGYRTAEIEPDLACGLSSVRAHVGTPFGPLGVDWELTAGAASVTVDVPFGITATLLVAGRAIDLAPGHSVHEVGLEPDAAG